MASKLLVREVQRQMDEVLADPNNWLKIPEFGVLPSLRNWDSFDRPLVRRPSELGTYLDHVRALVGAARTKAQDTFATLKELKVAFSEALDLQEPSFDDPYYVVPWTSNHVVALRYEIIFQTLDALQSAGNVKGRQEDNLAEAAKYLVEWLPMSNSQLLAAEQAKWQHQMRSKGGKNSAVSRREDSNVPSSASLFEQKARFVADGNDARQFAAVYGQRLNVSAAWIRKKMVKRA
jgi:hypothetical protein